MESLAAPLLTELYEKLGSSPAGLTGEKASLRRKELGYNEIKRPGSRNELQLLARQFSSSLVLVLIGAAIVSLAMGGETDALVIGSIVLINGGLSFYQERKTGKIMEQLQRHLSLTARVRRNGRTTTIGVRELVPGDMVYLRMGNTVPTDLRLIQSQALSMN
jgi:magnesium-transporting ATPase (P-type)